MIHTIGTTLAKILIAPIIFLMSVTGYAPVQETQLGATLPISGQTYTLAGSGVSAAATSITLSSLTLPQTGYEILDADMSAIFYLTLEPGNRTKQEIVSCTTVTQNANDTATLSGCVRGLLPISPYTASSTYAFAHGGGTSVIFSNPPQLYNQFAALDNNQTITGVWSFPEPTIASSTATKSYVDALSFGGIPEASSVAGGFSELATGQEAASSTVNGGDAILVLPASIATSTAPASGHVVPVTGSDGNLAEGFLPTTISQNTTFSGSNNFSGATTTFSGFVNFTGTSSSTAPVIRSYASTTATSTWSKPTGLKYVIVEVVGGGGGGGGADASDADDSSGAAGGGAGGYSKKLIATANLGVTETVTTGAGGGGGSGTGGDGSAGATSSFGAHVSVTGGVGGFGDDKSERLYQYAAGGTASSGDLNISGGVGQPANASVSGTDPTGSPGAGGASFFGGSSGGQTTGPYGAGGYGARSTGGGQAGGGAGAHGIVIVTEYFF
jgi:hypothetical protein